MTPTLQSRILQRFEEAPDARALLHYSDRGRLDWQSRAELLREAAGATERLMEAGLEAGDTCLLILPADESVESLTLGAMMAGAAPLLLAPATFWRSNPDLDGFLGRVVARTGASVVVRPEPLAGLGERTAQATRFLPPEAVLGPGDLDALEQRVESASSRAALQMTSGTTSRPKICSWSHEAVLETLDQMAAALRIDRETVFFNWTPLYHDLGLVNNFLFCLVQGIPLANMSPIRFVRDPATWLQGLSDTQATTTWSPNFGYSVATRRIQDRDLEGVSLAHVTGFWNAAEKIHLRSMHEFHRRFEPFGLSFSSLKASYGCAENVGGATFSAPDEKLVVEEVDRRRLFEERIAVPGSDGSTVSIVGVGRPVAGLEVKILSDDGAELPDGRVGEIALESSSLMDGYLDDAAANRQAFGGGRLRTGDLGYRRGDQLFWVGRVRERITVRGQKIDPSSFEPILLEVEGLREGSYAAFGVEDEKSGTERLILVAEARTPMARSSPEIAAEIRRAVFRRLDVLADEIVLVRPGSLAKTSSGKRRHRHFRHLYQQERLDSIRLDSETTDD